MSGCALGAEAHPLSGGQIEGMAVQIVGDLFVADILGVELVDQLDGIAIDGMLGGNSAIAEIVFPKVGTISFAIWMRAGRAVAFAVAQGQATIEQAFLGAGLFHAPDTLAGLAHEHFSQGAEHLQHQRLLFSDTENIRFGKNGRMQITPLPDEHAKTLLQNNRDEYTELQVAKLLENSLNRKVARELLRLKCGIDTPLTGLPTNETLTEGPLEDAATHRDNPDSHKA